MWLSARRTGLRRVTLYQTTARRKSPTGTPATPLSIRHFLPADHSFPVPIPPVPQETDRFFHRASGDRREDDRQPPVGSRPGRNSASRSGFRNETIPAGHFPNRGSGPIAAAVSRSVVQHSLAGNLARNALQKSPQHPPGTHFIKRIAAGAQHGDHAVFPQHG